MGSRIAGLTHLKSGKPIDAARDYTVAGWASVAEGTEGPPVWDLVEKYVAVRKTVKVDTGSAVKVIGN
jgi:sulfur-oxidizing protein SoxB